MKYITRSVWVLSLISLFTDTASEMLYPIMPIYLKSIGFSIVLIGILEGVVEATAGLSKGYFGIEWGHGFGDCGVFYAACSGGSVAWVYLFSIISC